MPRFFPCRLTLTEHIHFIRKWYAAERLHRKPKPRPKFIEPPLLLRRSPYRGRTIAEG